MEARASRSGGAARSGTEPRLLDARAADAPYRAALVSPAELADAAAAWQGLAARSLEPNVFAEPAFLGAALKHGSPARRVSLLAVWQGPALRGLLPFSGPRLPFAPGEARLWRPALAADGPPLVDRGAPEAVLEEMLGFLARLGPAALTLPGLRPDGALAAALRAVAERTGRRLERLHAGERAVVRAGTDAPGRGEAGRVESAGDPRAVRDAVEEFLALDALSARARSLPALIDEPGAANVVRAATRELARARRCRVDLIREGGRVAAAAIVLRGGDRAWLWRLAGCPESDGEPHGGAVPARRLAAALGRAQGRSVAVTASCLPTPAAATAGIWRGREPVADLRIATRPGAQAAASAFRRAAAGLWRGVARRRRAA